MVVFSQRLDLQVIFNFNNFRICRKVSLRNIPFSRTIHALRECNKYTQSTHCVEREEHQRCHKLKKKLISLHKSYCVHLVLLIRQYKQLIEPQITNIYAETQVFRQRQAPHSHMPFYRLLKKYLLLSKLYSMTFRIRPYS